MPRVDAAGPPAAAAGRSTGALPPAGASHCTQLRAWSASVKAQLAALVARAGQEWRADWDLGVDEPEGAPAARPGCWTPFELTAKELAAAPWHPAAPGLWWALRGADPDGDQVDVVGRALFGGAGAGSVARDLAEQAWTDWWTRLEQVALPPGVDGLVPPPERSPLEAWARWSGALLFDVPWPTGGLRILASGERVQQAVGGAAADPVAQGDLTPVWRAAASQRLRLRVQMEAFALELGELAGLRVGDVLRTAHLMEAPLIVKAGGHDGVTTELCAASLGRAGAWRAVELHPRAREVSVPAASAGAGAGQSTRWTR